MGQTAVSLATSETQSWEVLILGLRPKSSGLNLESQGLGLESQGLGLETCGRDTLSLTV